MLAHVVPPNPLLVGTLRLAQIFPRRDRTDPECERMDMEKSMVD
jgi:hypothetical protein